MDRAENPPTRTGVTAFTRAALWVTGLSLVALHVAPWSPPARLFLGWMPAELTWRLVWTLLAWLWLLAFCRWGWRVGQALAGPADAGPGDTGAGDAGAGDTGAGDAGAGDSGAGAGAGEPTP